MGCPRRGHGYGCVSKGGTRREVGGSLDPSPGVPGKKGSNLFYMIPLERWNTEHTSSFSTQKEHGDNRFPSLIGPVEHDVSIVFQSVPEQKLKLFTAVPGRSTSSGGVTCNVTWGWL